MLTPEEIKKFEFQKTAMGSYKAADVDGFITEVYNSYELLYNENAEFVKKLEILADKVEEYRNDEDNIRLTLLTSQRMADKIIKESNEISKRLINDANSKKESVLNSAHKQADEILSGARAEANKIISNAKSTSDIELASANSESERLILEATQKSVEMVDEANKNADKILSGARRDLDHETRVLEKMQREVTVFRARLMSMYKTHVEFINSLPYFDIGEDADSEELSEANAIIKAVEPIGKETEASVKEKKDPYQQSFDDVKTAEPGIRNDSKIDMSSFGFTVVLPDDVNSLSEPAREEARYGVLRFGESYEF